MFETREEFAERVMKNLRHKAGADLRYDVTTDSIIGPAPRLDLLPFYDVVSNFSETTLEVDLAVWDAWCAWSAQEKVPKRFEDAKSYIYPRINLRAHFKIGTLADSPIRPHQVVGEHLGAGLIIYVAPHFVHVTQEQLDGWDISFADALSQAIKNLADDQTFLRRGPLWRSAGAGKCNNASLLLTDRIGELDDLKGEPIAGAPTLSTLFITGSEDEEGLAALQRCVSEPYNSHYLSGFALKLHNGVWEDWMPERTAPLFSKFYEERLQSLARTYRLASEAFEARGQSPQVGVFQHLHPGSEIYSYTVWKKGRPELLPRTDAVTFINEDVVDRVTEGDWEHVQRVVGHLMQRQPGYPELYFVKEFPSPQEIERIRLRT